MLVKPIAGRTPQLAKTARVAENATLAGKISLGENAGVWYGATLRADTAPITVGANTNIQENAVLHVDHNFPTTLGANVTVGHGAIVHGCTVEDGCIIGMGAILLNGCRIGSGCIVAAGALVTQGAEIPPGSLVMGAPAKVRRPLTEEERRSIQTSAEEYCAHAREQLPLV